MKALKLAVRKVVELALRGGDIDNRYSGSNDAMLEGARAHRRLQKQYGEHFRKEVSLSIDINVGGVEATLYGRADGVEVKPDGSILVDEIKTTTLPLDKITEAYELHIGQAKCYAYMLLSKEDAPNTATVQLTYHHLESGETLRRQKEFTREELDTFFTGLLEKYGVWLKFEQDWLELRDSTIHNTGFPFPSYRSGQRELAVAVYRAIEREKRLYAQASTGIGKTISALFPSIKALGEGKADKIFYLTAKTVTRSIAEDAVTLMNSQGLRFKSLTLRAKDKICFMDESNCNPEYCPYAQGHYDRVNEAVLDMLNNNDVITPEITLDYAERHRVCPHEMALDASLWVDLVVGDYNHVFDPTACLKRFFSDSAENSGDYVFLIDEAHNLADRVRDMYSASLRKDDFLKLGRSLEGNDAVSRKLKKAANSINRHFIERRKALQLDNLRELANESKDEALDEKVLSFIAAADEYMAEYRNTSGYDGRELLELYFDTMRFAATVELYNECFCRIEELFGNHITVTYFCLDPAELIAKGLAHAKCAVLFSATLAPLDYYRELLGGTEDDWMLMLNSPFAPEHLKLSAYCNISTKYADRANSYQPIAAAIKLAVNSLSGNYMVFFPSYEYMSEVYNCFTAENPEVRTLVQRKDMSEDERAAFLAEFVTDNTGTLLGFCVLGGIFSEGIDLSGERLIGSIIVGVGLPKISLRQNLIKEFYQRKNGRGYEYAYIYPGMNKVLQAAGRVIRTEEDRGMVLLIDSRFATATYRQLFPPHWAHLQMLRNPRQLEDFFSN